MNQNNLITFQRSHTHSEKVQQRGKELRLSAEGQSPGPLVPPSKFLNFSAPSSGYCWASREPL